MFGVNLVKCGLWGFMILSEKHAWINDLIVVVPFEVLGSMWMDFALTINEWK
jgi:hypothetical protein